MKKTKVVEVSYELDGVKIKEQACSPGRYAIYIDTGSSVSEIMCNLTDNHLVSLKHLIQEVIDDKKA